MTDAEFKRYTDRLAASDWKHPVLDVSRFRVGDRCPRHVDRRVYAVDETRNLWCCVPSAMPIPWRHDQVIEHDAAEFLIQVTGDP